MRRRFYHLALERFWAVELLKDPLQEKERKGAKVQKTQGPFPRGTSLLECSAVTQGLSL